MKKSKWMQSFVTLSFLCLRIHSIVSVIQSILEMIQQRTCSLDTCICKLTAFLTIKAVPFSTIEVCVKFSYKFRAYEINKCISDVALVPLIYGKIQEINSVSISHWQFFDECLFSIFIRYMSNHKCGPSVSFNLNSMKYTCSGTIKNSVDSVLPVFRFCNWRHREDW